MYKKGGLMEAYKIDLQDYRIKSIVDGKIEIIDYGIKEVMANIICHPMLKHTGYKFYQVSKVADKIATCKKDYIVLDSSEYAMVKESFDKFEGFGRNDSEMVRRVYEAEKVEVEEKK